jgi:sarcosine oxidase
MPVGGRSLHVYDVVVVGAGIMGTSACWSLQRRGMRVLLLDQYRPPHELGSSQGKTRIIREAYFEDPIYVPLVQRAYELWNQLEVETSRNMVTITGGLVVGPPEGELVVGALRSAREHSLPYEELSSAEATAKFAPFRIPSRYRVILEPRAGVVHADAAIEAMLDLSRIDGAAHRFGERVLRWHKDGSGICVETEQSRYRGERLVLAAGPWINDLAELPMPLVAARQPLLWFVPPAGAQSFDAERFPIYLWQVDDGAIFYGFPRDESGIKVARHHGGPPTNPASLDRDVSRSDVEQARTFLASAMPGLQWTFAEASVCMYTNAADGHFVVDTLPADDRVVVLSACSGHGFKFAPAIGELVADMISGTQRSELSFFSFRYNQPPNRSRV